MDLLEFALGMSISFVESLSFDPSTMKYNHELINNLRSVCDKPSNAQDNEQLYPLVAAGDADARQQMIVNNLPLVITLVDLFLSSKPDHAHLRDDLMAEGFLSVVEVINIFVSGRKVSNPTSYLSRSIRRRIQNTAKQSQLICTPRDIVSPQIVTSVDTSKMMLGARGDTISSINLRDMIHSCCISPLEKTLVTLREANCMFAEMAKATNTPQTTVRRMFKAIHERFDAKVKELQQ
jgi:DNA-directed RNA polymerase specialized sigma24 family protein